MINKYKLLECQAEFSWTFGEDFFVETPFGNFIWNNPDYGGDNSFRYFDGPLRKYVEQANIPFVRCKGKHLVLDYCGDDIFIKGKNDSQKG